MKISEFIKYLEEQKEEHGNIDVVCVTPGCASAWETAAPTADVCCIVEDSNGHYKRHSDVHGDKFLFIGVDG